MNIIERLYYGDINPCALNISNNSKFEELLELMVENEESLINQLTEKQKCMFEKIRDCDSEISDITEREMFIQGFKLGAQIILEIMK